ncbi:MAG TPA: endonuclease/exonuclease/phosphatase family protein [Candidatus Sulfomarinibacteraceae bacterium]|nr:endonuclease/exonuclease/phosphatase family protein [Candidatus Sulfomarinibacteraceae bacterium]
MSVARPLRLVAVAVCLALPAAAADHLLVSEVIVTPTAGEYVEIFNPTGASVDLSDVYLTDATYAPGGSFYYKVVTGDPAAAGGGGFGDFHARFPDGAIIGAGQYQTVAIAGSDAFFATYGSEPTYELFEDGASPDAVPDMREALPGTVNGQGGLTNDGEVVVLYRWDGAGDLVQDLDYVLWGDKAEAVDKTGVSIDGPDPDTTPTQYLADTAVAAQDVTSTAGHLIGNSFTRTDPGEGTETGTGGNGATGHDETSENLSATFDELAATPNGGLLGGIGVSVDDVALPEGDGGTTTFTFTISLTSPAPAGGVTFDVATADDTATVAGLDYTAASAAGVVIPQGSVSTTFDVPVIGDLDGEINERFFVVVDNVSGTGAQVLDGTGDGVILNDDPVAIHVIQGAGESSLLEGSAVTTLDAAVTAIGPEGFFLQTVDGFDDGDPDTSEGLYVYTGSPVPPGLNLGYATEVSGTVVEFYGMTQLEAPLTISVAVGLVPMPPPVIFDALTPSPDPTAPSCALEYECFEGMVVSAAGLVVGPTQFFGTDPQAEFHAIAIPGPAPFREIGAEYPGMVGLPPTVPIFDGNREVFEVDPDRLGQPNVVAKPGDSYAAVGPLGYEFSGWEIWASAPVAVTPGPPVVEPVPAAGPGQMTVASLNMFRHYDDVDDPLTQDEVVPTDQYLRRQTKFRRFILDVLRAPDVLGVQEVENLDILIDLAADISAVEPTVVYTPHLVPGNNSFGMNVGYLVRDTVQSVTVTQLGFDDILVGWGYKLFDHPPLLLEGTWVGDGSASFDLAVMNNHTRSLSGVDDPFDDFARQKRFQQAQSIADKVQAFQATTPEVPLVVIGDLNAFQFTDGYVDVVGQIRGEVTPEHNFLSGPEITSPTLANALAHVEPDERFSYLFRGTRQVLDHALVNHAAWPYVAGQAFGRGNAESPGFLIGDDTVPDRASDHDAMVLYLDPGALLFADGFESGGTTAWGASAP